MNNNDLISILVITYNSSKYVLETLESAKEQTYKNIELVISDDCSTDNTYDVCRSWIEKNKDYFKNVKLTRLEQNKGISSNCNNGLRYCSGKFIKLIAGDDILLENCINDNYNYSLTNNCKFLFSFPQILHENNDIMVKEQMESFYKQNTDFYRLSSKKQFLYLITRPYPMNPPTMFFSRKAILRLDGFDERYFAEDFALYLKSTYHGMKLHLMPVDTIIYRVHQASAGNVRKGEGAITNHMQLRLNKVIKEYIDLNFIINHPLVAIEFYNQLFFSRLVLKLGNKTSVRKRLEFLRFLSPLHFALRFRNLIKKVF